VYREGLHLLTLKKRLSACTTRGSRTMAAKFEVCKDGQGQYRWRMCARNGQVIATGGEGYTTKANALGGIKAVQRATLPVPGCQGVSAWLMGSAPVACLSKGMTPEQRSSPAVRTSTMNPENRRTTTRCIAPVLDG
jgi:uncharacterized protein